MKIYKRNIFYFRRICVETEKVLTFHYQNRFYLNKQDLKEDINMHHIHEVEDLD